MLSLHAGIIRFDRITESFVPLKAGIWLRRAIKVVKKENQKKASHNRDNINHARLIRKGPVTSMQQFGSYYYRLTTSTAPIRAVDLARSG